MVRGKALIIIFLLNYFTGGAAASNPFLTPREHRCDGADPATLKGRQYLHLCSVCAFGFIPILREFGAFRLAQTVFFRVSASFPVSFFGLHQIHFAHCEQDPFQNGFWLVLKRLGVVFRPLDVDSIVLLAIVGLAACLRHPLRRQGEEEAESTRQEAQE